MPVNVLMPQMGESIAEGTIVRWIKNEGDTVEKDEPLLEISTDKVDAEVPSPASGTLTRIVHGPGDTVAVETVIGEISAEGEASSGGERPPAPAADTGESPAEAEAPAPQEPAGGDDDAGPAAGAPAAEVAEPPRTEPPAAAASPAGDEAEQLRTRSTPVVRRIAAEHDVDIAQVEGSGIHGRVTKSDILAFIEQRDSGGESAAAAPAPAPAPRPSAPGRPATPGRTGPSYATGATLGPSQPFAGDELREGMSVMRQKIAEHMVASRRTSPHVHTVFEADVSRVVALRERHKADFQNQHGIKLTYTPFFVAATVEALKAFPVVNASLEGSDIVFHRSINVGVAVALPQGLIVPVVKNAEELSLVGLQRAITDLANRARNKQLKPEDVRGSTFSITNPGPYGGLYGLPIINQPNVAILSTGGIQRRPVVVSDADGNEGIGIRDMAYLALSFDHRLIDGATADQFMAHLKSVLEAGSFTIA